MDPPTSDGPADALSAPLPSVQEQLKRALADLRATAAEAAALRSEVEELRLKAAENEVLHAEADELRAKATVAEATVTSLRANAAEAAALRSEAEELRLKAAENEVLRAEANHYPPPGVLQAKVAEADHLREALEEKEGELLRMRKQHEIVRHEDTMVHTMKTITSKGKMEKIGETTVHVGPEELRPQFTKFLDQALPSPPSAGAPPPAAIMHVLSEKDAVALLYRTLAVRNKGGMTGTELFEFHLHVAEDPEDPNLITLRTLSDDEAKRLCGAHYLSSVEAKRKKVDLMKPKRVQVRATRPGASVGGGDSVAVTLADDSSLCVRFARHLVPPPLNGGERQRSAH
jgi:hypothetical protein